MATEAYTVSEDGTRGHYLHLENVSRGQALKELKELWGQGVVVVPDEPAWRRAVRTPGPPDESVVEKRI